MGDEDRVRVLRRENFQVAISGLQREPASSGQLWRERTKRGLACGVARRVGGEARSMEDGTRAANYRAEEGLNKVTVVTIYTVLSYNLA